MNATITLQKYLDLAKNKEFYIPDYQRGYVWGKKKEGGAENSVTYMMNSLWGGYESKNEIFIQGVTVSESETEITLIDGQQRTTFFYLLLKSLGYDGKFTIKYAIRKESNDFLSQLNKDTDYQENGGEDFQDIFFFKETMHKIDEKMSEKNPNWKKDTPWTQDFCEYILKHVKFLYINIDEEKATKVFTMMNGNKAEMKSEELIKAELLRLSSLNGTDFDSKTKDEQYAIEWDNNMLRSRYAREWDKWLQWWNRKDVQSFFDVKNVMGLLVSTYQKINSEETELSYAHFRNEFLRNQTSKEAKTTFDGLRRLQKRFEDAFNSPIVYNKVGAIIRVGDKDKFIQWYFLETHSTEDLDRYYKWAFLGLTHKEIIDKNKTTFDEKFDQMYDSLKSDDLYKANKEAAFRLLLRLNIDEDNKQENGKGRKFDFSIWNKNDCGNRSLEHIYPKSKVWHEEKEGDITIIKDGNGEDLEDNVKNNSIYIGRDSCTCKDGKASEHSIGNLVLLYNDENSSFNDSSFSDKKAMFFKIPKEGDKDEKRIKQIFKSRHLLHTIYKFANSEWNGEQIARNKYQTLKEFQEYYKEYYKDEKQN